MTMDVKWDTFFTNFQWVQGVTSDDNNDNLHLVFLILKWCHHYSVICELFSPVMWKSYVLWLCYQVWCCLCDTPVLNLLGGQGQAPTQMLCSGWAHQPLCHGIQHLKVRLDPKAAWQSAEPLLWPLSAADQHGCNAGHVSCRRCPPTALRDTALSTAELGRSEDTQYSALCCGSVPVGTLLVYLPGQISRKDV